MIRFGYLLPRLVFLILVYLFFYVFFDKLVKWSIEKGFENIFEAKVEIKKLKISFLKGLLEIENMSVGNKRDEFRNIFEFKKLRFELNPKQIFRRKFVVEEAKIDGLLFNGIRNTSAKIKREKNNKDDILNQYIDKYISDIKDFAVERVEDIKTQSIEKIELEKQNLETLKIIEEIKNKRIQRYKEIYSEIEKNNFEDRIRKIEEDFQKLKVEKDIIKQTKLASKLKKDIDETYKIIKEKQKEISNELKEAKGYVLNLEEAKRRDIQKISSLLRIPSFDKETISIFLFGEKIYREFATYAYYFDKAVEFQKYLPEKPKKRIFEEKRKRGRDIHYILKEIYPTFLLKRASVNGVFTPENPIEYNGSIENISSNPNLYPKPLIVKIFGKRESSSVSLNSKIELATKPISGIINFDYLGIKLSGIEFGDKKISFLLNSSNLDLNLITKFVGDEIDSNLFIRFYDVNTTASVDLGQKNVDQIIKSTIDNLKSFGIKANLKGKIRQPTAKLTSDLGDILAREIEANLKKELDMIRDKINQKVNQEIDKKLKEFEQILKEQENKILERFKIDNDRIEKIKENIEKEIKKKIKL